MIQGKCPLISIPLIKKEHEPVENLAICRSFLSADRLCFPALNQRNWGGGGWFGSEVNGKRMPLLCLGMDAELQSIIF